jgi:hypothetical protein
MPIRLRLHLGLSLNHLCPAAFLLSYRDQDKEFPNEAPTERIMIAQGATL